jgi:hypothetical protein
MAKDKTSFPIDVAQLVGLFIESVFYGCVSICFLFRSYKGSLDPIVISTLYYLSLFFLFSYPVLLQGFSWNISSVVSRHYYGQKEGSNHSAN